jgi:hypothetical protein
MNLARYKALAVVLLLVVVFSCDKEEPVPPYVTNNSVKPEDFLKGEKYEILNIEVAYVEGYQPTAIALSNLQEFLRQYLNKPGGITVTQHSIPATGRISIDVDVIREIEKAHRTSVTSGNALTAFVMFLDAEYSESTETKKVLGIAYGRSSMAVFEKSVYSYTSVGMTARRTLESLILSHEAGHLLGLVNNGVPMIAPHQDSGHGAHCSNAECLMYWKSESNVDLNDLLGSDNLPQLDANCLADLKAAGGR